MALGPDPRESDTIADAEFAELFGGLAGAGLILVAVSGGPDSTALMHALAGWSAGRGKPELAVATVDHGLRPGSRCEAVGVGKIAGSLGLGHATLPWTGRTGPPSQEAARRARYRLLVRHADVLGATHLVTAHTLDDQAETLLIRLAAGSGLSGLGGMRRQVRRGGLFHVRPFIAVPKARLVATCLARRWDFVEDPSNSDPAFARARWRRIMPVLAAEGLHAQRLGRLAERLAQADVALDLIAGRVFAKSASLEGRSATIPFRLVAAEEPPEIALRVMTLALERVPPAPATGEHSESGAGGPPPVRLERLEACFAALCGAASRGLALRRTLAGRLVELDRHGILTVRSEGVRRRGRSDPVTPIQIDGAASLGMDPCRA